MAADKGHSQERCPPGQESQSAQRRPRVSSFCMFSCKPGVIYDTLVSKREKINCQEQLVKLDAVLSFEQKGKAAVTGAGQRKGLSHRDGFWWAGLLPQTPRI